MQLRIAFRPRLLDALQGYQLQHLARDVAAGVTVGLVALPLAMAFAIASGLKPEVGLFTAILAGFLISALGGSRVQIGGPAGAYIVIVYGIVHRYGYANLVLATFMSGLMLLAFGIFRLGVLVRFIPVAVIIGFTNGIAVLIGLSQVKDFLGLQTGVLPADFFSLIGALWRALPDWEPQAAALAAACLLLVVSWNTVLARLSPVHPIAARLALVPGSVMALVAGTLAVSWLHLPIETIGTKFGGIPSALPALHFPSLSWETARFLFIPATTLALLGAIESLLCARVADGMTGDRHDPNQELMAQGIANCVVPFFGGMPATGTIARTVTNIKSGAVSPIAGMVHALTLLVIILVAAPLAQNIPLAAMAAILMLVAWNMGEWRAFASLQQFRLPYRITLLAVFVLTVVVDLTVAVEVGLVAACLTFIYRISSLSRADRVGPQDHPELKHDDKDLHAFRLHGALFFGAVQLVEGMRASLPGKALVLDFSNVLYIDSSGADAMLDLLKTCRQKNVQLVVCGLTHQPLDILTRCGLVQWLPPADLCATMPQAIARAAT